MDQIVAQEVCANLSEYGIEHLKVEVLDEVVSTNTLLKTRGAEGAPAGTVVIADTQTGGRGRLGRSFYSPNHTGLYISVLLRPSDMDPAKALHITTMAAVAACEAIEDVMVWSGLVSHDHMASDDAEMQKSIVRPKIKWVNDIILQDRKVAGILTESAINATSGKIEFAVLGIGLNVYAPEGGFPEEIKEIAGAILPIEIEGARSRLAAAFLNHFFERYACVSNSENEAKQNQILDEYVKAYKARSIVLGKSVNVIPTGGGERRTAQVLDITDDCNLLVAYTDGECEEAMLSSGEVSIRPIGEMK